MKRELMNRIRVAKRQPDSRDLQGSDRTYKGAPGEEMFRELSVISESVQKEISEPVGKEISEPVVIRAAFPTRDRVKKFVDSRIEEHCRKKRMKMDELVLDEGFNLYESGLLDSFDLYQFLLSLQEGLGIALDIAEMDPREFTHYETLLTILTETSRSQGT